MAEKKKIELHFCKVCSVLIKIKIDVVSSVVYSHINTNLVHLTRYFILVPFIMVMRV